MIDLLINYSPVDLPDEGISILFQRQRTDYTNPTIVRNSFTKTITLPGTKKNNEIFDQLWKLDRGVKSPSNYMNFNPSQRNPFMIMKDGNLVEQGYVKLNRVVWNGNFFNYEITLYGELGNLLYGLSYMIDEDSQDIAPLTLGDLNFGFDSFQINRQTVKAAWQRLQNHTGNELYDTLNFCVSYDGVPQANNFDPKKVLCSVGELDSSGWGTRHCRVRWSLKNPGSGDESIEITYPQNTFPTMFDDTSTSPATEYRTIHSGISRMDPIDYYGLFDLKNGVTPLETRDLRSYLLRPVINVKKMFQAIGSYINNKFGYTLDMTDPFFSSEEFEDTWMTLSMLYEIDAEVETNTVFTKRQLFSNTSSPASYLISYCKIYGIYLDVDYFAKKLVLTRLPNFFNSSKNSELKVDLSKEVKITPLSFDKATYTFDYGEGDSEFLKKYKDTYGIQYGSRKVNTGYRFDASSAPYIDNNIFRQGVDVLEQSVYYKYGNSIKGGVLVSMPQALVDEANLPTYSLFNYIEGGDVNGTYGAEMKPVNTYVVNNVKYFLNTSGYMTMDENWTGLRPGVYQDGFPKLQLHSEDNKGVDGKDILLHFNGFQQVKYGNINSDGNKSIFNRESKTDYEYVIYLLSDDDYSLKHYLGINCYYDNPAPAEAFGGDGYNYITVVKSLPSFTRCSYSYTSDQDHIPVMYTKNFDDYLYGYTGSTDYDTNSRYLKVYTSSSSSREYVYCNISGKVKNNHRYFIAAAIKTSSASTIINSGYNYADLDGSTMIDHKNLEDSPEVQLIGSIIDTGSDGSSLYKLIPLSSSGSGVIWYVYYIILFDLTEYGLQNKITTAIDAINYFGLTATRPGYPYFISDTLDFGISRELYIPSTVYDNTSGIYNKYWDKYIADVYSINTRVMECYCYLDNINDVFREFYYYDNCLWILSKIVDWNMETKYCKGTFIKVNNIESYTS